MIMCTVSLQSHTYMRNSDSVRQKLKDLKNHLPLTDEAREIELAGQYSQLMEVPASEGVDKWLRR